MRYAARGACYLEPAFGVIIPRPDDAPASEPDSHGVAHRITVAEFLRIVATEGGGGHPELGYSIVEVTCETTTEPKRTLTRVLSLGAGTKCRFDLLCSVRDFVLCSWDCLSTFADIVCLVANQQRYKEIVIDGAKQGGVDPAYIEYLESIPYYDRSATFGRQVGRTLFVGLFA